MTEPGWPDHLEFGMRLIQLASVRVGVGPLAPHQVVTREQARLIMDELQRLGTMALAGHDAAEAPRRARAARTANARPGGI